jgi:outer membrane protein
VTSHRWLGVLAITGIVWGAPVQAQTNPAPKLALMDVLRESLKQNSSILLQRQQVLASEGARLQAQGQFDAVVSAEVSTQKEVRPFRLDEITAQQNNGVFDVTSQTSDNTTWRTGVEKTLPNGMVLGTNLTMTTTDDSTSRAALIPEQTAGRLNFTLKIPLLRNSGRAAVGAAQFAADAEYAAAQRDLVQTNAQTVLNTTLAYWSYLASLRRLSIAKASEQRAGIYVQETEKLIKADQMPRAEADLLLASRAEKQVARLQAEQSYVEARRALARSVGLSADQSIRLADPADEFPAFTGQALDDTALPPTLIEQALRQRADLEASRQRELAAQHRVTAASNGLKPQTDLSFSLGYRTLSEGRGPFDLSGLGTLAQTGPVAGITLSHQWPYENSAARGGLMAQAAAYDSSTLRTRDLESSIANNVAVQIEALRRAATQLAAGEQSAQRYLITLRNEQTKRRLGLSTMIDLLNVQDRLDNALSQQVQLQSAYAAAIAQLRFEVGTLVRQDGDVFDVRAEDLISPDFGPR